MAEKKVLSKSDNSERQKSVIERVEERVIAEFAGKQWSSPHACSAAIKKIIAEEEGRYEK